MEPSLKLNSSLTEISELVGKFSEDSQTDLFQELKEYGLVYPVVKERQRRMSERLLEHAVALARYLSARHVDFGSLEDVLENYDTMVDVNDVILERVDACLDEKRSDKNVGTTSPSVFSRNIKGKRLDYRLIHAPNIMRPQLKFEDKIDNFAPIFTPILKEKHHALIPLEQALQWETVEQFKIDSDTYQFRRGYPNPYAHEIMNLSHPDWLFDDEETIHFKSLAQVPCHWVDRLDQLENLIRVLERQREIAVDLEHHNYRSYQGFVCIMQISTREEDYLLDTLALRSHIYLLNKVFANSGILKVFHGADSDIVWLQRDFGIYVVNLFDTGQAARVLNFPNYSLAYLLSLYANVQADKRYQLADWRIRPLTNEMFQYAREDTHYLLYIFDELRKELLKKPNSTREVLQRSRNISLKTYDKEATILGDSHMALTKKYNKTFSLDQLNSMKALINWRDRIAREEDESVRYVLPNSMLLRLVEAMPTEASKIMECCNPIPPLVRIYANDLAMLLIKTRDSLNHVEQDQDIKSLSEVASLNVSYEQTSVVTESLQTLEGSNPVPEDPSGHLNLATSLAPLKESIETSDVRPLKTAIKIQEHSTSSLFEVFRTRGDYVSSERSSLVKQIFSSFDIFTKTILNPISRKTIHTDTNHDHEELKQQEIPPSHVAKETSDDMDPIQIDGITSDKKRSLSSASQSSPSKPKKSKPSKHPVKSSQDPIKIPIKPFDYMSAIENQSKTKGNGETTISRGTLSNFTKQQVVGKTSVKTSRIFSKSISSNRSLSYKKS